MNQLGPFGGLATSVDARYIGDMYASDLLNVRIEDGAVAPRYGFRKLSSGTIPSGFTAAYGMHYLQGYNASYTLVEEYACVETRSGNTYAYSVNASTGARSELLNGASHVALNASRWKWFSFYQTAYGVNASDTYPVITYTLGTTNTLTQIKTPADPSTALTYAATLPVSTNAQNAGYSSLSWGTLNTATQVTYTGVATSAGSSVDSTTGIFSVGNTTATSGDASFEIDVTAYAGSQNWQYNDRFVLRMAPKSLTVGPVLPDWDSFAFVFTLSDGTTTAVPASVQKIQISSKSMDSTLAYDAKGYAFELIFDPKVSRSLWSAVKKIKVSYKVLQGGGSALNSDLMVSPIVVGGIYMAPPLARIPNQSITVGYSYYSSSLNLESGIAGTLNIPVAALMGVDVIGSGAGNQLGAHLSLTATASAEGSVDTYRFYVKDDFGVWRRIVSQASATAAYKLTWAEVQSLTAFSASSFDYTVMKGATPFKGWVVWLAKGGYQNVRHSRVGQPLQLSMTSDYLGDDTRGATFSLSDNFSDEPLCAFPSGDTLVILGSHGAYAQVSGRALWDNPDGGYQMVGHKPSAMTPPKKLPDSKGCAGQFAACLWQLGDTPGVAYVSQSGEVWFARVSEAFDGTQGYAIDELTLGIRGQMRTFLLTGQSSLVSDFSTAMCGVDQAADALWVVMGQRAMVLRRKGLLDGFRQWEQYSFNFGGSVVVNSIAFSATKRLRASLSDGRIVELEYNSNATPAYAPITGTSMDDGSTMPAGYWTSKKFVDARPNRRVIAANIERDTLTDTPTLTVYTTKSPSGVTATVASGARRVRVGAAATGAEHWYKLSVVEGQAAIRRVILEEAAAGERKK